VSAVADAWFSAFLGVPCALVHMPDALVRPIAAEADAVRPDDAVSFADAMPLLLTSEASLADLHAKLPAPLPMDRFRPNVVVAGGGSDELAAYAEDGWRNVRIGAATFDVAMACDRCVMTTIDQATAEKGTEPLATLARVRRSKTGASFGQYLIPRTEGARLRVGDVVTATLRA
jgi:uncharacterized protein YcbX